MVKVETKTKTKFFMILECIILAAVLPSVAFVAFGIIGGLLICFYAIVGIIALGVR